MRHYTMLGSFPSFEDNCDWYRGRRPFSVLKKLLPLTVHEKAGEPSWSTLSDCDVVFLQRPHREEDVRLARLAYNMRIPIWVDYDDDLLNVPLSNPTFHGFRVDKIKPFIDECCSLASAITVSTANLAMRFPGHNNVRIIPNAYDDYLLGTTQKEFKFERNILWRGSWTHEKDVLSIGQAFIDLSKRHPEWYWTFMNYLPWQILERMDPKHCIVVPPLKIVSSSESTYFDYLRKRNHAAMVVPLFDCPFNRSKSNIAWIESTYGGMPCLAPDWEEWQAPGVWKCSDPSDFYKQLEDMMYEEAKGHGANTQHWVDESWEHMMAKYRLSLINTLRRDLVVELGGA